jgi:CheY-like chemotaxis protein
VGRVGPHRLKYPSRIPFSLIAGSLPAFRGETSYRMSLVSSGGAGDAKTGPRKLTIVVVDDCEVTLASTAETLERAGYRVITRERPAGCIAMMLQEKPDLVLLDVCMPTVSGDTLVKLFSKASPNSGTIILLYSALDEHLLRGKAKGSGAHGYIVKTHDATALVRAIRRWLRPSVLQARVTLSDEKAPLSRTHSARADSTSHLSAVSASSAHMPSAHISSVRTSARSSSLRPQVESPVSSRNDLAFRTTVSGEMRRVSGAFRTGPPTVLFVDDDMMVLSGYRRQLHGQPFDFDFALSGAQALRLMSSTTPPSVVVSDLLMPEPNGCEILRRALDLDPSWSRRFIIVTGQSSHDARLQLDSRFFGALLRKPVETDALSAAIRGSLAGLGMSIPVQSAR